MTDETDCEEEIAEAYRLIANFVEQFGDEVVYDQDHEASEEATYRAIGRFIKKFSSIEFTMRFYLTQAVGLGLEHMSAIVTHDFALLCTAVTTVYSKILETDEERKTLKQLMSKCRAMNDLRVKVVHGHQWFPDYAGGTVAHISRQNLELKDTSEMAEKLEQAAKASGQLFWELQFLLSKFAKDDSQEAGKVEPGRSS